jgi:hypothetical protein
MYAALVQEELALMRVAVPLTVDEIKQLIDTLPKEPANVTMKRAGGTLIYTHMMWRQDEGGISPEGLAMRMETDPWLPDAMKALGAMAGQVTSMWEAGVEQIDLDELREGLEYLLGIVPTGPPTY